MNTRRGPGPLSRAWSRISPRSTTAELVNSTVDGGSEASVRETLPWPSPSSARFRLQGPGRRVSLARLLLHEVVSLRRCTRTRPREGHVLGTSPRGCRGTGDIVAFAEQNWHCGGVGAVARGRQLGHRRYHSRLPGDALRRVLDGYGVGSTVDRQEDHLILPDLLDPYEVLATRLAPVWRPPPLLHRYAAPIRASRSSRGRYEHPLLLGPVRTITRPDTVAAAEEPDACNGDEPCGGGRACAADHGYGRRIRRRYGRLDGQARQGLACPSGHVRDLIFWPPERDLSADEVVDQALAYRPIVFVTSGLNPEARPAGLRWLRC